jgi:hypothetical protein
LKRREKARITAHTAWLLASGRMVDQIVAGQEPSEECPRCGEGVLQIRWLGDIEARRGDVYCWCPSCKHGVGRIRCRVSEGVPDAYFYDGTIPIPAFTEVAP